MKRLLLLLALAACRQSIAGDAGAVTGDLSTAPVSCSGQADCYGCCADNFESGALDYDSSLSFCACTNNSCAGACAATVCGSTLGVDRTCNRCLMGQGDGGACVQATSNCISGAAPCAAFADCIATCP